MIVTHLTGGLGNQMFQYAAGLALAHRRRTVLKLDVSWYREHDIDERRYALGGLNITEQFATAEEIARTRGRALTRAERWSAALARRLHLYHYARDFGAAGHCYAQKAGGYDPGLIEQPDGAYLDGLWQSERYFASVAGPLRRHFTPRYPASPAAAEMAARIGGGPSIAVHFRRGDYVSHPAHRARNGALPLDYYRRALDLLLPETPGATLYIFSDDIESVAAEFRPEAPHVFVRGLGEADDFEPIRLMSLCRHAVIANSTFSWWAAWLNPHPEKKIVAPVRWFADPAWDASDLLPPSWRRI